jgi:hypothetical protein
MKSELLSLRQTATILDLPTERLFRLGRLLGLASNEPCLPRALITRAAHVTDPETRYLLVLDWLQDHTHQHRSE